MTNQDKKGHASIDAKYFTSSKLLKNVENGHARNRRYVNKKT